MLFSSFCVCVALTLSSMSNPRSQFATCGHERAGRSSEVSEGNVCPSNSQSSFCRNTPHRVTVGPRRGRGGIGQSSLSHSPVPGPCRPCMHLCCVQQQPLNLLQTVDSWGQGTFALLPFTFYLGVRGEFTETIYSTIVLKRSSVQLY